MGKIYEKTLDKRSQNCQYEYAKVFISCKGMIIKTKPKWLKLSKTDNHKCLWGMEHLKLLYVAGGSKNWKNYCGKLFGIIY